jgi:hypothetical protein
MDITKAQFADFNNTAGKTTFSYAQLLAQIVADLGPTGAGQIGMAAVARGANQDIGNLSDQPLVWDTIEYDDLGFLDVSSGSPRNERFIIPDVDPPINKVLFGGAFRWSTSQAGDVRMINMRFNFNEHGQFFPEAAMQMVATMQDPAFGNRNSVSSGPTRVAVDDIFTLSGFQDSGGPLGAIIPTAWILVVQ